MTALFQLSELTRSLFSLWTLILCLIGIFSIVRSVALKRFRFAAFALLPFGCSYFLWQVLFDMHLFGDTDAAAAVSRKLGAFPWIGLLLALLVITPAAIVNLSAVIRYGKRSVTPDAVKLCLDWIPCGVCCFDDDGRVLFSNVCMNRLCIAATGSLLQNGNQFYDAVGDSILTLEGRRWRFVRRELLLDGERLHELTASDVTAEYAKTEALQRDKEALSRLKAELNEYNLGIDDTVRKQEILRAKVNIHDEMNRLMLSTVAAEKGDTATMNRIFRLWEQNALLLCMEADRSNELKAVSGVEKLAEALKIRLVWKSDLPETLNAEQRGLFFSAAQEALANAAKHAEAKRMEISLTETDEEICCTFTNDGKVPTNEIKFAGGLYDLSVLAAKQGATLSSDTGEAFTLILRFPKNVLKISHVADDKTVLE